VFENYFDNAATTPLDPEVFQAMLPYLTEHFGNAHSLHSLGARARNAVEVARISIAESIGAEDPSQVFFTSGATESNNWALSSSEHPASSPFEHASIYAFAQRGRSKTLANAEWNLFEDPAAELTSVMVVNNECGAVLEPPKYSGRLHRDATQAVGKVEFNVGEADLVSFNAHKLYGPKGVGALYVRQPENMPSFLIGGGQESGWRAGTVNVPAVVGFGTAVRLAVQRREEDFDMAWRMRNALLDEVLEIEGIKEIRGPQQSPWILCLCLDGLQGETLVTELDASGFQIGSGAACSATEEPHSHVLTALGLPESNIRGAIRVSLGRFNTIHSAEQLGRALVAAARRLYALPG